MRGEFATELNDLMYSEEDIKTLRYVVDSLNLRFKTCNLNRIYYSLSQAYPYYLSFSSKSDNLKEIISDIKRNISFRELLIKYASFLDNTDSTKLVIKTGDDAYLSGTPGEG